MSFSNYYANYDTPRGLRRQKKPRMQKRGESNPDLMALKSAVYNPWSLVHAGIPDGKNHLSNKVKYQTVFEIPFGNVAPGHIRHDSPSASSNFVTKFPQFEAYRTLDLLFFPGLNNMILVQPPAGSYLPLRYRWPEYSGPPATNPASEGTQKVTASTVDVEGTVVNAAGIHARRMETPIPYPLYAHESFQVKDPVQPGSSFPFGTIKAEFGNRSYQYRQVAGYSEFIHQPEKNSRIEKWRLVSAGLRISCTNNATSNTGWWEAIRVNVAGNTKEFGLLPQPSGINANFQPEQTTGPAAAGYKAQYDLWASNTRYYIGGKISLTAQPLDDLDNEVSATTAKGGNRSLGGNLPFVKLSEDMPNNNTYSSGKVRDLHKHVFKLKPSGDEHDYKEIPELIRRSNYGDNWPFNDERAKASEGDEHAFIDDLFDAIHIRIHSVDGTNLLFHYVANQELVYDENSNFARSAELASMSASDAQIGAIYTNGIPAAATTQPSHTRSRVGY